MNVEVTGNPGQGNNFQDIDMQSVGSYNPNATVVNQYGMNCMDVCRLCHDIFRSEFALYTQWASVEADERLQKFLDKFIACIKQLSDGSLQRFQEPAIQFALHETMKEYIRSGKEELDDDLIDLLIERLQVEEYSAKQALIDEARQVLPKLSSSSVAVLAMLAFVRIVMSKTRPAYINVLGKLSPMLGQLRTLHGIDIACLEQARCGQTLPGIVSNNSFIATIKKEYDVFFTHPITIDTFNQFVCDHQQSIGNSAQVYTTLAALFECKGNQLQYQYSVKPDRLVQCPEPEKSQIIDVSHQLIPLLKPYSDDEIRQFFLGIAPHWQYVFNLFERQDIKFFKLSPVGTYIGTRKLSRLLGEEISIELYFGDR